MYTTHPHSCSYLEDQEATTLFVDPHQEIDSKLYSSLSALGFRRSGSYVYRPHCSTCHACIPARVPVQTFKPNRSQRRTLKRNRDLHVVATANICDDAAYELYRRYIEARHADGDMYPPDKEQYKAFLNDAWDCTRYYRFYHDQQLLAISVVDVMLDGLSAIYTFFEPEADERSLGKFAVLWQIEQTRTMNLPYLYLGYWINNCRKMAYKANFQPLQLFIKHSWHNNDVIASDQQDILLIAD